ncbi:serine O-acetyltransferase [Marinobacter sp. OP 3.4]|uniref:serine O-acetyltransferase n=1 Tax=Marinobacter sp. OP 3.4 TaxID=3076501 RepID=UPI002E1DBC29
MASPEQLSYSSHPGFTNRNPEGVELKWEQAVSVVERLIMAALMECCSSRLYHSLKYAEIIHDLTSTCTHDLITFSTKDPSAGSEIEVLARASTSFTAVLHYRIANWIHRNLQEPEKTMLAALLSRRGKLLSGAEIHYKCSIGQRFVLDHGYGTVIGETTRIGNDCYILGGVTLGSREIADNLPTPRHPQLGDRVQVGMNATLLGPIEIGDDAFIGTGCLVSRDVPPGHRVTLRREQNITVMK